MKRFNKIGNMILSIGVLGIIIDIIVFAFHPNLNNDIPLYHARRYSVGYFLAAVIFIAMITIGAVMKKNTLQEWVDYARLHGSVILYDAAYEAYISDADIPHSIYECEGARECAIEFRSFSKTAGFTGLRLGFTVVPKELKAEGVALWPLWARRHGTKYNGAPYIIQRAGEAVHSQEGRNQVMEQVAYYMENAKIIYEGLKAAGYEVSGGVNAPYIWLKTPGQMKSWEFFDYLLEKANVVGTPGSGFGPHGEHYFRLTAFGDRKRTMEAVERIRRL